MALFSFQAWQTCLLPLLLPSSLFFLFSYLCVSVFQPFFLFLATVFFPALSICYPLLMSLLQRIQLQTSACVLKSLILSDLMKASLSLTEHTQIQNEGRWDRTVLVNHYLPVKHFCCESLLFWVKLILCHSLFRGRSYPAMFFVGRLICVV